jgi:hypothetical protein
MDKNISAINFYQYGDREWDKYAGNKFMYMNRARHDDYIKLFKSAGHDFLEIETEKDERAFDLLKNGKIKLDIKFKGKDNETLSITEGRFITKKNGA